MAALLVVYYTSAINEEARKPLQIMAKAPIETFNLDVSEFLWNLVTKVTLKISTVRTTENVDLLRNSSPKWERIFLHNKTINIDCKYYTNK
jgi:hypothetical protein